MTLRDKNIPRDSWATSLSSGQEWKVEEGSEIKIPLKAARDKLGRTSRRIPQNQAWPCHLPSDSTILANQKSRARLLPALFDGVSLPFINGVAKKGGVVGTQSGRRKSGGKGVRVRDDRCSEQKGSEKTSHKPMKEEKAGTINEAQTEIETDNSDDGVCGCDLDMSDDLGILGMLDGVSGMGITSMSKSCPSVGEDDGLPPERRDAGSGLVGLCRLFGREEKNEELDNRNRWHYVRIKWCGISRLLTIWHAIRVAKLQLNLSMELQKQAKTFDINLISKSSAESNASVQRFGHTLLVTETERRAGSVEFAGLSEDRVRQQMSDRIKSLERRRKDQEETMLKFLHKSADMLRNRISSRIATPDAISRERTHRLLPLPRIHTARKWHVTEESSLGGMVYMGLKQRNKQCEHIEGSGMPDTGHEWRSMMGGGWGGNSDHEIASIGRIKGFAFTLRKLDIKAERRKLLDIRDKSEHDGYVAAVAAGPKETEVNQDSSMNQDSAIQHSGIHTDAFAVTEAEGNLPAATSADTCAGVLKEWLGRMDLCRAETPYTDSTHTHLRASCGSSSSAEGGVDLVQLHGEGAHTRADTRRRADTRLHLSGETVTPSETQEVIQVSGLGGGAVGMFGENSHVEGARTKRDSCLEAAGLADQAGPSSHTTDPQKPAIDWGVLLNLPSSASSSEDGEEGHGFESDGIVSLLCAQTPPPELGGERQHEP